MLNKSVKSEISRKDFLYSTALFTASAALLSLPGCGTEYKYSGNLRFLTEREAIVLESIIHTFFPDIRDSKVKEIREFKYAESIEDYLLLLDPYMQGQFRLSLKVVEYGPYVSLFSFSKFTDMSFTEREDYLRSFMNGKSTLKKSVFEFVKLLSTAAFYQNPATKKYLGLNGLAVC